MAYISTEEVKAIRQELKKEFPNIKFSVTKESGGLSVNVSIMKSEEIDFTQSEAHPDSQLHYPVNHYYISEHYKNEPKKAETFNKVVEIIKKAPAIVSGEEWFDESDVMTDYFNCAYYFSVNVGKWNKPYQFEG